MAKCECRAACDEMYYEVSYSLALWPAPGFDSNAVYDSIFHENRFMDHFNDSQTIRHHFNETGDRTNALRDFARINVYVADPEVDVIVRPLSTVEYTRVASVFHRRQWSD